MEQEKGSDPITIPKIFRLTDSMGVAFNGLGQMEETDTQEEYRLGAAIEEAAQSLSSEDFSNVVKQVSNIFCSRFNGAVARIGWDESAHSLPKIAELMFTGYEKDTALLQSVDCIQDTIGECLPYPQPEYRPTTPEQYIRYDLDRMDELPLLIEDSTARQRLPVGFTLDDAKTLAIQYVRAAITSSDPRVGGNPQLATIPVSGTFDFINPP